MDKKQLAKISEFPKRYPVNGTFELTVRCNLHCKMCLFRHDDNENEAIIAKELTTLQWIDMAKQVSEAGTGSLLITGGEPMIRSDFCEVWEEIYKHGFLITLYTNATLITPKIMQTLKRYPPHRIGITIYGANPETYQRVCGNADAFQKAMEGIRMLQTLPSILEFRTTIIKDNYLDVNEIENLVHAMAGEEQRLVQARIVTKAVRGACADVEACRLSPEENVKLVFRRGINILKEYYGENYDENNLYIQRIKKESRDNVSGQRISLLGCDAGMNQYTISWDGRLLGCQMLGLFGTDVIKDGFLSAWERFPSIVKVPKLNEKCKDCNKQKLCNCCIASRYAETSDAGGCPEYVCRDTEMIHKLIEMGGNKNE